MTTASGVRLAVDVSQFTATVAYAQRMLDRLVVLHAARSRRLSTIKTAYHRRRR